MVQHVAKFQWKESRFCRWMKPISNHWVWVVVSLETPTSSRHHPHSIIYDVLYIHRSLTNYIQRIINGMLCLDKMMVQCRPHPVNTAVVHDRARVVPSCTSSRRRVSGCIWTNECTFGARRGRRGVVRRGKSSSSQPHSRNVASVLFTSSSSSSPSGSRIQSRDGAGENQDDFECTSSPAVELTVRALAKDIARGNGVWTSSLLGKDVVYKDRFCSMKGIESYSSGMDFFPVYCRVSHVTITGMRMLDDAPSSKACIEYTVVGTLNKPVDMSVEVDMTTIVTLNLLTGQIEAREDSWKTRSFLGALAFNVARFAWGSFVKSREAGKTSKALIEKSVGSVLGSLDDDGDGDMSNFQADPRDPMKFFQQNDSFKDDATAFILFLLVLYIIITGYTTLFSSGGGSGGF